MKSTDYETRKQGLPRTDIEWTKKGEPENSTRCKAKVGNRILVVRDHRSLKLRKGDRGTIMKVVRRVTIVNDKAYVVWLYKAKFDHRKRELQLKSSKTWSVTRK